LIGFDAAVGGARASLEHACDDLDAAVRALAEPDGETVMASPVLLGLLVRVVAARRHLKAVELDGKPKAVVLQLTLPVA
jgi:hypothetical protein